MRQKISDTVRHYQNKRAFDEPFVNLTNSVTADLIDTASEPSITKRSKRVAFDTAPC